MESIIYLISIFSEELLLFQGLFISVIAVAYFGYLIMKKRRYGLFHKNTSAFIVKEYLNEVIGETEEVRNQLFGILSGGEPSLERKAKGEPFLASDTPSTSATSEANVDTSQFEKKISELTAKSTQLEKDKKELEEKLKNQPKQSAEPLTGDSKELADKIKGLEDRLAEYSIIEDDLANLKKLQQENAQLKAALEGKGGSLPPPAAEETKKEEPEVEAGPEKAEEAAPTPTGDETPNFEELVDDVEKSLEEPQVAAAPEVESPEVEAAPEKVEEEAPTPAEETVEPKQEAKPKEEAPPAKKEAAPAPQPEVSKKESTAPQSADKISKEDEDLLKEFERMLNV